MLACLALRFGGLIFYVQKYVYMCFFYWGGGGLWLRAWQRGASDNVTEMWYYKLFAPRLSPHINIGTSFVPHAWGKVNNL